MKKFAMLAAALVFAASPALAAGKTMTGTLSDAKCNGTHHKAEHGAQHDSDHDCVTKCVESGSKMVFVSGGKTYQIAIFAINGPISVSPINRILLRETVLEIADKSGR